MIKTILWDVDGTLLDFNSAERNGIKKCFERFGLGQCSDGMLARYSEINDGFWKRLERGEVTKAELLRGRFEVFFGELGISADIAAFGKAYEARLGEEVFVNDDAPRLISSLRSRVRQYIVTNGTEAVQERKLQISGLGQLVDGVFISGRLGAEKPSSAFFDQVWDSIGARSREEVMIVGDSLSSDMLGGRNAGLVCCWYNPQGLKNDSGLRPDCEITNLWQVTDILEERA